MWMTSGRGFHFLYSSTVCSRALKSRRMRKNIGLGNFFCLSKGSTRCKYGQAGMIKLHHMQRIADLHAAAVGNWLQSIPVKRSNQTLRLDSAPEPLFETKFGGWRIKAISTRMDRNFGMLGRDQDCSFVVFRRIGPANSIWSSLRGSRDSSARRG
jgi:hypothetical protein